MTTGLFGGKYNDNDTPIKFPINSVSMNFYFKFSFEKKSLSVCRYKLIPEPAWFAVSR